MKKNIGNIDRLVRIICAVVFAALYFMGVTSGWIGMTLLIIGGVLLATAFVDFCPIYKIFRINTIPPEEKD